MSRLVLFVSTASHDNHDAGPRHPERRARLTAVEQGVDAAELGPDLVRLPARQAERAEIERVHDPGYLDALAALSAGGGGRIDPDTRVSEGSWTTALWAAGAGLAAIAALERGEGDAAFVAGRPPGHHADRYRGAGFCLVNNIAVAAAALVDKGERVAIVDWDVHHGNGTQDVFWNDPQVLYASTHQWPWYPGTGRISEQGGPDATGLTLNVPLPAGATGDVARAAVERVIGPAIEEFRPGWLLVSAGFDAHRADPLADLAWSAGDYADLADLLTPLVPAGRVAAFLEGGYDLDALAASVQATVSALAGGDVHTEAPTSGGPGLDAVDQARKSRAATLG